MDDEDKEIDEILREFFPDKDDAISDNNINSEQTSSSNEIGLDANNRKGKILETTKVARRWRITLTKQVRGSMSQDEKDIEIGDRVVFKKKGERIVIEIT